LSAPSSLRAAGAAVARPVAGPAYRRLRHEAQWLTLRRGLARTRCSQAFPHIVASHATPLMRVLPGVDMQLQRNKVVNLRIAADRLDGVVLRPGERLSFWRLVGAPSPRRGFVEGLVLDHGRLTTGVGGGLCPMTNLLFWMTLHTPLEVVERWRHSYDVFPDAGRIQPFGSGATCAWPSLDLQIANSTGQAYRLSVRVGETHLQGEWTCDSAPRETFVIEERGHHIMHEGSRTYLRHNELWEHRTDLGTGETNEQLVAVNHALLMYVPFLER